MISDASGGLLTTSSQFFEGRHYGARGRRSGERSGSTSRSMKDCMVRFLPPFDPFLSLFRHALLLRWARADTQQASMPCPPSSDLGPRHTKRTHAVVFSGLDGRGSSILWSRQCTGERWPTWAYNEDGPNATRYVPPHFFAGPDALTRRLSEWFFCGHLGTVISYGGGAI